MTIFLRRVKYFDLLRHDDLSTPLAEDVDVAIHFFKLVLLLFCVLPLPYGLKDQCAELLLVHHPVAVLVDHVDHAPNVFERNAHAEVLERFLDLGSCELSTVVLIELTKDAHCLLAKPPQVLLLMQPQCSKHVNRILLVLLRLVCCRPLALHVRAVPVNLIERVVLLVIAVLPSLSFYPDMRHIEEADAGMADEHLPLYPRRVLHVVNGVLAHDRSDEIRCRRFSGCLVVDLRHPLLPVFIFFNGDLVLLQTLVSVVSFHHQQPRLGDDLISLAHLLQGRKRRLNFVVRLLQLTHLLVDLSELAVYYRDAQPVPDQLVGLERELQRLDTMVLVLELLVDACKAPVTVSLPHHVMDLLEDGQRVVHVLDRLRVPRPALAHEDVSGQHEPHASLALPLQELRVRHVSEGRGITEVADRRRVLGEVEAALTQQLLGERHADEVVPALEDRQGLLDVFSSSREVRDR
mmetsp:Transcript_6663/g.15328  ORF Transcript_6663/g.15328 Transcript_6663/m.15328 type:complete len:463 (-) Transcript_6663:3221-4609(-)